MYDERKISVSHFDFDFRKVQVSSSGENYSPPEEKDYIQNINAAH